MRSRTATTALIVLFAAGLVPGAYAQVPPDHPVITEVYADPPGANDGPVGRDLTNLHQEYIEIYLPQLGDLDPGLNKDMLNLTFYEVEGDYISSNKGRINYRIDLPTFDLDPGNGLTGIPRPASGVVVLGWVDYVGNPPTDLAGTPSTRLGLIDGGITSATDFVFIAINGAQFSGTANFPVPVAISQLSLPNNALGGVIENESQIYLLVNADDPGYVELYDVSDLAHVPPLSNAEPSLSSGTVLQTSCLLDAFAGNEHGDFEVIFQPYSPPTGDAIDMEDVLPSGGAYSRLTAQLDEAGQGYARLFADMLKTTDDLVPANDDPVADALNSYRTSATAGPLAPTPGRVHFITSPAELSLADDALQTFDVLTGTTGRPGIIAANAGGDFEMIASSAPGPSSNPGLMSFAPSNGSIVELGQTLVHPAFAVTVDPAGVHGATATSSVLVTGVAANPGDPVVENPSVSTLATVRAINPQTGVDAIGFPFQATALVALQGLPRLPGVPNEFAGTQLAAFVAANLGGAVNDERTNGLLLTNPTTNLADPTLIDLMEDDMPDDPQFYINFPGVGDDLVTTVLNSAEVVSGKSTYDLSFNGGSTLVQAVELTIAETRTNGGIFTPIERIHYTDAIGRAGQPDSGLTGVITTRGFELALLDSNVRQNGTLETGAADDFGLIVEVGRTGVGASVVTGEFVFLSLTGGLEGADIDTMDVPPHGNQTVVIYLDLDALDTQLGAETITRLFVVNGSGGGTVNIIEAFSLAVDGQIPIPVPEPSQMLLLLSGGVLLVVVGRRRMR